ncbi:MAG TPA: FadR family transcriptional regulator [Candidatus Avisuccinivibrio pullicola]|nr:FadR family transcriptional regulator [Candidatus Avisuccinivibrio pullicola]
MDIKASEAQPKQRTWRKTYAYLREKIVTGKWPEGKFIPSQKELSLALNVSLGTVREVEGRFIAMGILKSEQGRGTWVHNQDVERLLNTLGVNDADDPLTDHEILEYRQGLELMGMEWGLSRRLPSAAELKELRTLQGKVEAAVGRPYEFAHCDRDFHSALTALSGNRLVVETFKTLSERADHGGMLLRTDRYLSHTEHVSYHTALLSSLERGDSAGALRVLRAHLQCSLTRCEEAGREIERKRRALTGTQALQKALQGRRRG